MATINGTSGIDTKVGTSGSDIMNGYAGNDTLSGRDGNDSIWGGDGNDKLLGENNDDSLWGGNGNDIVYGGAGNDKLYGDAGTDTIKGDAGNDLIKGGTGIGYLYGGEGDDQLYYDPSAANVSSIGSYLSGSILDGGAGTDTLNIFNKTTYTSGSTQKASQTHIYVEDGTAHIKFMDPKASYDGAQSTVGKAKGVEKMTVEGNGGLDFIGDLYGNKSIDITGTAKNDTFQSYYASDTMRGGLGDDIFEAGGGNDRIISLETDSDSFNFNGWGSGTTTITGFNGEGVYGGDRINISDHYMPDPATQIKEANGWTTFTMTSGDVIKVDAVGLDEAVDYFFV